MLKQSFKKTVFRRYNNRLKYVFLLTSLLIVFFLHESYLSRLNAEKKLESQQFIQTATALNQTLNLHAKTLKNLQAYAEHFLASNENNAKQSSLRLPSLEQNNEHFYLATPSNTTDVNPYAGDLKGVGEIDSLKSKVKQQLALSSTLMPLFKSAKTILHESNSFHYIALNHFIHSYPKISINTALPSYNLNKIKPSLEEHETVLWNTPFSQENINDLTTSLFLGVYHQKELIGKVMVDLSLSKIEESLTLPSQSDYGLMVIDKNSSILFHHPLVNINNKNIFSLTEILIRAATINTEESKEALLQSNLYLQKQKLPVNDWVVIQYRQKTFFTTPFSNHFLLLGSVIIFGCLLLFILIHFIARKIFLQPTQDFILHIEHSAKNESHNINPAKGWGYWFEIVEDIFQQNRSLLKKLTNENVLLDARVVEKTQALKQSIQHHQRDNTFLRSVMNAIPEFIIFNDQQGRLIGCNKAFEDFVQKSEHDLLGCKASEIVATPFSKPLDECDKIFSLITYNNAAQIIETLDCVYEIYNNQFYSDNGHTLGTINIIRDITKQFTVNTTLETAKNQAEQASKAKSQFLANVSHEIRTPINAIQGMLSLIAQTELSSLQAYYLSNAETASGALLHLINDLLDLSVIEAGKMIMSKEEASLDEIVDKALKLNIGLANSKELRVVVNIAANVPKNVMTDEMRLVQVLMNLLNNAIKFTLKGQIYLSIEAIANNKDNALVRFRIVDSGIGIAKENLPHLFEAFKQADDSMTRKYGGTGLGLSICQQIVNLLGGEIKVISEENKGSEFYFTLPFPHPKTSSSNKLPLDNVQICSLGAELSPSLLESIYELGGQYKEINTNPNNIEDTGSEKIVLLVSSDYFISHLIDQNENLWLAQRKNIILVGLCQPIMSSLDVSIKERLEQLSIPNVLLEIPLYRVALFRIIQALNNEVVSYNEIPLNQVMPNHQVPLLEKKESKQKATNKNSLLESKNSLKDVKILLVEDNIINQLVAKELLSAMQAKVVIADNGQIAIDLLESEEFDLVLMDIQMPVMDGLTSTKLIREQDKYQQLPIVAMTAHAREEDRTKSLAAGMNDHIAKPVSAEQLKNIIVKNLHKNTNL